MFNNLLDEIEKASIITLYRHINADMDALGSQFGLKYWIMENYPEKQVYAIGDSRDDVVFEASDYVEDEIIQQSLAIVLDCSNSARVDDTRFLKAKTILTIDHHPKTENFMKQDYRFVHYAATCEILTEFFLQAKKGISKQVATCLYRGLLTDTSSFKNNNTSAHTLKMAMVLCEAGIDIMQCNQDVFNIDQTIFQFSTKMRSIATVEDCGLVYCILNKNDFEQFGLTASQAKDQIFQFQSVNGFEIWCIFTEMEKGIYNGSLRSKIIPINQVATLFNGGGHACASGVKDLDLKQIEDCLNELRKLLSNS